MKRAWKQMLIGTAMLFVAAATQAQSPANRYTPQTAPTLVDPSPVYRPPVYVAAVPPTSIAPPIVEVPEMAPPSIPTPTPTLAPWPVAQNSYDPTPAPSPYPASSLPGYGRGGTPAYAQTAPPSYAQQSPPAYGEMAAGTFDRQTFPPYGTPTCPPKYKQWMPTRSAPVGGCCPGPVVYEGCEPSFCGDVYSNWFDNIALISEVNAFKSPVDLDSLNGNFGTRVGAFGSMPLVRSWGLGAEFGGTAGYYDWKGTQYTGAEQRTQYFATAGLFQRFSSTGIGFGLAYDFLLDDYYSKFRFGQFRVAGSWQWNACNEIGIWAALPDSRDFATFGTPPTTDKFGSVLQGNLYWRHVWTCAASTTLFGGVAESPSDITWGASGQVAINNYMALTGGFEYILPGSGGDDGRQEEIWAMSFGVSIYPGSAMRVAQSQFRPFLPMADNGNFAIRRF